VKVAPIAWAVKVAIAILWFGRPAKVTLLAATQGALFGIFPIMYIPFGALVVYNTMKATGWMDKMQGAMAGLTTDRRAQALLIGFGFSAFLEGICGFGAPVAIPASILVGLGFDPFMAALVCLVANTGPVPYGSLAIPTDTLALTTGLDVMKLSQMTGRFMAPMAFLMAFATVFVMSKLKGVKGALPAILVTGISFSVTEFLVSNYPGATLTAILSGLVCLACTATYLSMQRQSDPVFSAASLGAAAPAREFHPKELFLSWLPYLLLAVLEKKAFLSLADKDVYINVVGGLRLEERANDLAVAMCVASSLLEAPLPPHTACIGEISLTGEIRPVSRIDKRVSECARLGYGNVILAKGAKLPKLADVNLIRVSTLGDAVRILTGK
jgi:L-lactate permease